MTYNKKFENHIADGRQDHLITRSKIDANKGADNPGISKSTANVKKGVNDTGTSISVADRGVDNICIVDTNGKTDNPGTKIVQKSGQP